MIARWSLALGLAALLAAPAMATDDPRILTIAMQEHGLVHVDTAPDLAQIVLFQSGEQIVSVVLSDPTAYSVTVPGAGDSLSLRAMRPGALSLMTVRTRARSYSFELASSAGVSVAPIVRLVPARTSSTATIAPPPIPGEARRAYKVTGAEPVRPTTIFDDGVKTYIEWAGDRAMPATFALGPSGDEQMVEGYMRGGVFTIDRVYDVLVFRIDKQSAKAKREAETRGRG